MEKNKAKALLDRYNNGTCTPEERALVETWFLSLSPEEKSRLSEADYEIVKKQLWQNIEEQIRPVRSLWPRIAAAASVLLVLSFGGYLLLHKKTAQQQAVILPGGNKAILLSRGKQYAITGAKNGLIVQNGNTVVNKTADGELAYSGNNPATMVYDTLVIPRGGQYRLKLNDGTVVYLNADSKLRYPESFSGPERVVELLSGEADFEVAHNAAMPFRLRTGALDIRDIGTEFNVNAYGDEPVIKTTLISGSISVNHVTVKPGQQAVSQPGAQTIAVSAGNPNEAIAWKNGYFRYDSIELTELMKQVARWYDIEVAYAGPIGKHEFYVDLKRKTNLSDVLKILELGGVHFKISGRKLTIIS